MAGNSKGVYEGRNLQPLNPSNIKRKRVLQEEGGPVRKTFTGSFDTTDLSKRFLISEYPLYLRRIFPRAQIPSTGTEYFDPFKQILKHDLDSIVL